MRFIYIVHVTLLCRRITYATEMESNIECGNCVMLEFEISKNGKMPNVKILR
ncbi:MAG: hypothetical protein OEY22_03305 [Candidatus Bathyarchaeota archaeon]|nr:hypothetical protein [Candidatus Bathyarchaeota archaeon]MDH5786939.1 hypothetical protein [Candidatus Bathyarchaeota archaeon]